MDMANKNRLVVKAPNAINEIQKRLSGYAVSIGIQKDAGRHKESDLTVAAVYAYNEFGTERIPERPTLRPTFLKERIKYIYYMGQIAKVGMEDKNYDIRQAMGRLGQLAEGDVKAAIVQLKSPPNAESTIAKKKSSNPLIDTNQMLNSVRWAYVDEGKN